ncbi:MAG: acetylxylan esterase [Armatimonadota bacterium]
MAVFIPVKLMCRDAPRRGLVLAPLLVVLLASLAGRPAEAAGARGRRPSTLSLTSQADGSLTVATATYSALVGADGNLHSLRVGETEMLDDKTAISLGCFFYADGPRRLGQIQRRGNSPSLRATDGTFAVRYRFAESDISLTLENGSDKPVPYFVVLSGAVTVAARPGTSEAAAVPANERWAAARLIAANGAYVELSGGTRIWGPWLGRQVWEASQVPARGNQQVRIAVGTGQPPRATLEQLVGVRAEVLPSSGLVESGQSIEVLVSLDNRSGRDLQATLSAELSGSRSDMVVFTNSPLELPAQRPAERTLRWQVGAPDFYQLRVTAVSGGRQIGEARAVAGYEVSRILPQVVPPDDLDGFWQRLIEQSSSTPTEYALTRDDRRSRAGLDVWLVRYRSIGDQTIFGWYAAPSEARRLPAVLYLSGYGARPVEPPLALARKGWAALAIDVRGNRPDRLRPRPFEDYCTEGIDAPDTYVYRDIVAHALRAVEFLRAREEVDPDRVAVAGVSEGGGVALIVAALTQHIAAVSADAPILVDFPLSLRAAAWPYTEIGRAMSRDPQKASRIARTLSYYDVVNLAPRIRCPVLLSIGLLDRVSLPAAVYGLYNVLPGPKEIRPFPQAGHEGGGEDYWTYKLDWLSRALDKGAATPGS